MTSSATAKSHAGVVQREFNKDVLVSLVMQPDYHRRTSQLGWGLQPPNLGKAIILGQKLNFSGRSQQPKMKNIFLVFIKRKNGIHTV